MTRTTWQDYPSTATPLTAANLNNIETRIEQALDESSEHKDLLDALTQRIEALEGRNIVTGIFEASSSATYENKTIGFGTTFPEPPKVWFSNMGTTSNTMTGIRVLAVTTDSCSVQVQIPSGTLGGIRLRWFAAVLP